MTLACLSILRYVIRAGGALVAALQRLALVTAMAEADGGLLRFALRGGMAERLYVQSCRLVACVFYTVVLVLVLLSER